MDTQATNGVLLRDELIVLAQSLESGFSLEEGEFNRVIEAKRVASRTADYDSWVICRAILKLDTAVRARVEGDIEAALMWERRAQELYDLLPASARWGKTA